MGICPLCKGQLYWSNDFSFDDYGMNGEGLVSVWSCSGCGATAEFYLEEEEEEWEDDPWEDEAEDWDEEDFEEEGDC